jgi:hypothetical protein
MEQIMKTYEVELKRTSYVNILVEADSLEEAELLAWAKLETFDQDEQDASWECESIEEWTA